MASNYTATDAHAYERLIGRWSARLAEELIAFAGIDTGDRVLDVGCGTGSLAVALAARPEPAVIVGLDIAAPYIAYASTRSTDPRLTFLTGDAAALDLPTGSFDRCFSLLALNFVPNPIGAVSGMARITGRAESLPPLFGILPAAWSINGFSGTPPLCSIPRPIWRGADILPVR
jgi:ubiquinone/menaquinone biosynthesis C-methylase UbiE